MREECIECQHDNGGKMTVQHLRPLAAFILASAIAACSSDVTGANPKPVKLSFTSNVSTAAASTSSALKSDLAVGPAGDLVLVKGSRAARTERVLEEFARRQPETRCAS